jgi:predicted phage-related endonuclease
VARELDPMRLRGLTSTDMGAIFGVDPDRDLDSVHAVKKRGVVLPPIPWRWELGQYLETAVMDIFEAKTGHKVEKLFDKTFQHPKYPHIMATPDALLLDENSGADAKVCSWDQRHKYGESADEIPDRVALQVVTCMEVMQRDSWYIALLSGDQFRAIRINRDPEFGEWLMTEATRIWRKYFEGDERPPVGGSRITSMWLQQAYPKHKRPDIRVATDEEVEMLTQYGNLRMEQKALMKARATMENQLKDAIKDREGLEWPGGKFTWRKAKDSQEIDWQSMAIALRTHYIQDEEARAKLTADYTRLKPGVRRIYFKSDQFVESEETENAAA